MTKYKKLHATLLVVVLITTSLACGQWGQNKLDLYELPRDKDGTGLVFLYAVAYGDEELAMSLVSTRTQGVVTEHCEDGKVLECFRDANPQEWNGVAFLPGYSSGLMSAYEMLHRTGDPTLALFAVLEIVDEQGQWRVDNWRGFVPLVDSELDGLISGSDTTNLFPPEE